jgi:hypothetical protein
MLRKERDWIIIILNQNHSKDSKRMGGKNRGKKEGQQIENSNK